MESSLFEDIMLFDALAFEVVGENVPLAVLIGLLGARQVESLIEQDALAFVLWNQVILHMQSDVPGLDPLGYGKYGTEHNNDPEESIRLGLNRLNVPLTSATKRSLIRKVRDLYSVPDDNLSERAVGIIHSAYDAGRLTSFGLTPEISTYRDLPLAGREKLGRCAEALAQYQHVLKNGMTSHTNFQFYQMFNESNRRIHLALSLQDSFDELCKIENLPNFQALYYSLKRPFESVSQFRSTGTSKKFRRWIARCEESDDGLEISKQYVEAISKPTGLLQTKPGRIFKSVALSALGGLAGAAIGGAVGATVGAGSAKTLEPAIDIGLDLLDEFALGGRLKGWTPKMFFSDMEKLSEIDK